MFDLTHQMPKKYWIACSGGIDSVSALHWLHHNKPSRKDSLLGLIHIDHNTDPLRKAARFVIDLADEFDTRCKVHFIRGECPDGESLEMWWRNKRYEIFKSYNDPIILAHNFDDCLEEYVMSTMVRDFSGTIPYSHANCVRPFRLWKRKTIQQYADHNGIKFVEDPSNADTKFKRNYIRHKIIPHILHINPGVYNIVRRLMNE